jgi:hypothetical protein
MEFQKHSFKESELKKKQISCGEVESNAKNIPTVELKSGAFFCVVNHRTTDREILFATII